MSGYEEKRKVWVEANQKLDTFSLFVKETRDWLEEKKKLNLTWKQVRIISTWLNMSVVLFSVELRFSFSG